MFKDFIKQEAGIDLYPLISLTSFAVFFLVLLILTFRYKKDYIEDVSRIPLDEGEQSFENYDLKG